MSDYIEQFFAECKKKNLEFLRDISPEHKVWDDVKENSESIALAYSSNESLTSYGEKVSACSSFVILNFYQSESEIIRRINSWKCRIRHCPICQRARSLNLQRQLSNALALLTADYPKYRWVFLTLTVPNCDIHDLGICLSNMNKAWQRLIKRKELSIIKGWMRSTEVTKGKSKDNTAHPHFHALMLVPSYYFSGNKYIKQEVWSELWKSCMKLDVMPVVDVRTVKSLEGGLKEVVKVAHYSLKPSEVVDSPEWFTTYHEQVSGKRFLSTGGLVKDYLKAINLDEVSEDEDDVEEETEILLGGVLFNWNKIVKRYKK